MSVDLSGYIERMRECIENGDTEMAHSDADEILAAVVAALGGEQGTELVALYVQVGRWYA